MVHTSILKQRSWFFSTASSDRWSQAGDLVKLPVYDPEVFDIYLRCTYGGGACIRLDNEHLEAPRLIRKSTGEEQEKVCILYAKAYVLADKVGDPASANSFLDSLVDDLFETGIVPGIESIEYVWTHSTGSSLLRKLFVDLPVYVSGSYCWETTPKSSRMPQDFLVRIAREMASNLGRNRDEIVSDAFSDSYVEDNKSRYHQKVGPQAAGS